MTVKQLILDQQDFELYVGTNAFFTVTAEYLDGRLEDVTDKAVYHNSNPQVASVSRGTILARSAGHTDVTVSFQGKMESQQRLQFQ